MKKTIIKIFEYIKPIKPNVDYDKLDKIRITGW